MDPMEEKSPEKTKKDEGTAGGLPVQETGGSKEEGGTPSGEVELYDAIIPVGTPRSVIREVLKKYPVQLVERKLPVYIGNMEGEEREILAFRGPLPVVEEVEKYIREQLAIFAETGGWKDREKKPS
ncbi:MAG: hypothetical protein H6R30_406 [Methanomicrobia archaeon]|nr:hypothetical protein [Methanomicrobiales archaeon]MBS1195068.1 hypothetical protein [Methanomicrobia archaeon]